MIIPKNYWILLITASLQVPESASCLNPVGYDVKRRLLAYIQRLTAMSDVLLQNFIWTLSPLHWNEVLMSSSYESKDQVLFLTWSLSFLDNDAHNNQMRMTVETWKDFLDNGKTWLQCFIPTLYAISVLRHLDLKTHFDNYCILFGSMCVLLEKRNYKVNWIA